MDDCINIEHRDLMSGSDRLHTAQPFSSSYRHILKWIYPSIPLHLYGVNGKISGSIGAVSEIDGNVVAVLHGPSGCGYHYRFSSRCRYRPFFKLISSELTEREIVMGGIKKLRSVIRDAEIRDQRRDRSFQSGIDSCYSHPCQRSNMRGCNGSCTEFSR